VADVAGGEPPSWLSRRLGGGIVGQDLRVLTKDAEGEISESSVLPVAFVPLEGG
jgi:hypothetical protein